MQIQTTRFGVLDVKDDEVLTFTQPIIGFQEYRRFVLVPVPTDKSIRWLQSVDSSELAFLLIEPHFVMPDYKITLNPHELAEMAVTSVDELEIYTLLVVPEDLSKVRTNLKAPILINPKQRLGKQTVLEKSDYPIQCFLAAARKDQETEEVSHARTDT